LRWNADTAGSPDHDFEQISVQPGEVDFDFEIHDEYRSDGDFDGLENVRTCCDGAHTVSSFFVCLQQLKNTYSDWQAPS
jgi:hypothetical protein